MNGVETCHFTKNEGKWRNVHFQRVVHHFRESLSSPFRCVQAGNPFVSRSCEGFTLNPSKLITFFPLQMFCDLNNIPLNVFQKHGQLSQVSLRSKTQIEQNWHVHTCPGISRYFMSIEPDIRVVHPKCRTKREPSQTLHTERP